MILPVVGCALLLLHGLPWSLLVEIPRWPAAVTAVGSAVLAAALITFPLAMVAGHGRRARDGFAVVGDLWLGFVWQLFAWSVLGAVALGAARLAGAPDLAADRVVAVAVLGIVVVLSLWGYAEARRIPRVRTVEIDLPRLGAGLDGLRVVLITDTHFGPLDRSRWSARVAAVIDGLRPDVLAHAGDLADGSVERRATQVAPLAGMRVGHARVYITGNHEYMSGAVQWVDHLSEMGWTVLRNQHLVVTQNGSSLVVAGVNDRTAHGPGATGHHADLAAALKGSDPALPVLLLSHQPRQVDLAVAAGVDLQLSGHTHAGQIWPFHLIVRAEQGFRRGLRRPGGRTQLYTSGGTGFWGPPFRVFAPSEITLLILRPDPRSKA